MKKTLVLAIATLAVACNDQSATVSTKEDLVKKAEEAGLSGYASALEERAKKEGQALAHDAKNLANDQVDKVQKNVDSALTSHGK